MLIPFTEPSLCRYIYINPANNRVHLMMPIVSGISIGLDNTCQAVLSVNVFCASNRLSIANFGEVLDQSEDLSQEIAACIVSIQSMGGNIENTLLDFINEHQTEFKLTKVLTSNDFDAIKKRFTEDYAEIKDSPHFDEFMLLDKSHPGLFVEHQGSIAIDFSEFAKSPQLNIDSPDFEQTREEYKQLSQTGVIPHKNEHIEASIEVNLDVLDELDKLPLKNRLQLLKQMPELQLRLQQRDFLHHVAKGEQQQAEDILKNSPEIAQRLLTTSGQFTDYSGRTFNCTAYEYAYWAKDKHMCRMLESHMIDDTKAQLLAKVEVMEESGLVYQQPDDQGVMQIKQSKHFDMTPLITALREYINGYRQWDRDDDYEAMETAWMKVGKAQRDVPAHIAHEYCRPDRSFAPLPSFGEENLPRILTFAADKSWFPLSSPSSGLGFDFALIRASAARSVPPGTRGRARLSARRDLAAVRHLDEVRIADLTQSRENLSRPASQLGLGR